VVYSVGGNISRNKNNGQDDFSIPDCGRKEQKMKIWVSRDAMGLDRTEIGDTKPIKDSRGIFNGGGKLVSANFVVAKVYNPFFVLKGQCKCFEIREVKEDDLS
jgi:hypothetical protein